MADLVHQVADLSKFRTGSLMGSQYPHLSDCVENNPGVTPGSNQETPGLHTRESGKQPDPMRTCEPTKAANKFLIYCDGACEPNPGTGGWGAVILEGNKEPVFLKGGPHFLVTNNRMEILAVVEALRTLPVGCQVVVRTDSQLVVNTMTRGWRRNKNQEWWAKLDREVRVRQVCFEWVRGHSGHRWNEAADALAVEGASPAPPGVGGAAAGSTP